MANPKLNLPDDLLSSKPSDPPRSAKDDSQTGNVDEKLLMGFSDDSKDQVPSESSIPLSPQWLYAKPTDSKPVLSAVPADVRMPGLVTHGTSVDPAAKEAWRPNGSQDKKEWRRNTSDIESGRRWREEERETGLIGRRDRKKEGDREKDNEYRKNDRRSDNSATRESTEARSLPSSDWRHDVASRSSAHETRWDSKWSSRWGPEDKEDSRSEKKLDGEKEDAVGNEKQSFISSNRTSSERDNDGRDKWRPRHRQESHPFGPAVYRAAPGFGLERGKGEVSNVGFAPGRGRSNISGRPSTGPIGAALGENNEHGYRKSALPRDAFCYPRGKLLDIYRKQKHLPPFDSLPVGFEEVPSLTQSASVEPLAFVVPDVEEEAILRDIGKGKIIGSEVVFAKRKDQTGGVKDSGAGINTTLVESKHLKFPTSSGKGACETTLPTANDSIDCGSFAGFLDGYSSKKNMLDGDGTDVKKHTSEVSSAIDEMSSNKHLVSIGIDSGSGARKICLVHLNSDCKVCKSGMVKGGGHTENFASNDLSKIDDVEPFAPFHAHTELPDDSSSLFDLETPKDVPSNEHHRKNDVKIKLSERVSLPEELSLFYRDPQGEIQGPFWGLDIISWFQQGFFGTELPVCLSDAPEGTPFQELGEIMPHLKCEDQALSVVPQNPKLSDMMEGNLDDGAFTSDFTQSTTNDQWSLPDLRVQFDHVRLGESNEGLLEGCHELSVVTPGSSNGSLLGKPTGSLLDSARSLSSHQLQADELGETILLNYKGLRDSTSRNDNLDSDVLSLGLLWSEEGTQLKHSPLSNISSDIADQVSPIDMTDGRENLLMSHHKQSSFSASNNSSIAEDTWSGSYGRNSLARQEVLQEDIHRFAHMEQDPYRFNLTEEPLAQQLQKQLLQQQHLSNHPALHLNGSVLEQLQNSSVPQCFDAVHFQSGHQPISNLEHLLKLQFQEQQQLELQERRRLQQQQFELEQCRLQQQQQFELQEQQRLLQQQFELQEQRRLQQQQQQFEFQEQHRLQQQLHHQMHLQQQLQQSQTEHLLLKQLLHHQMHDPALMQSQIDPLRNSNMLDQVLFRQQVLHGLQQQSHPRHHDPSIEHLINARIGQGLHLENRSDLLELLTHAKHGNMLPVEQQLLAIQQERMKTQQLSVLSRQQLGMEEDRLGRVWSVDESGAFVRAAANSHQMQSGGVSSLDFYQQQRRPSLFEQSSDLERTLALHGRLPLGIHESSSSPFERSMSLPAGGPDLNIDIVNSLARVQDMQERHVQMHSTSQLGSFSSGIHSQSPKIPNQFNASHLDGIDTRVHPNSLTESKMNKLHHNSEWKKRDATMESFLEDPNSWPSDGNLKRGLMDVLHRKIDNLPNQSLELRELSSSVSDYPYDLHAGETTLGEPFVKVAHGSNFGIAVAERANGVENTEKSSFRRNPGAFNDSERSFQGINETIHATFADSAMISKSSDVDALDFQELTDGKKSKEWGSKSNFLIKPVMETQESGIDRAKAAFNEDTQVKGLVKNASLGSASGSGVPYNYDMGVNKIDQDWMPNAITKEVEDSFLKHPPVSRALSPQVAWSELAAAPAVKAKISTSFAASEEKRRDPTGSPATQISESSAPSNKDMRFLRTSSFGDAGTHEPSFIDMLKSTKKPQPETDATLGQSEQDAHHGGKGGKKKGKKGRQIDPALLGFKVSSNRIMMGEIQKPVD